LIWLFIFLLALLLLIVLTEVLHRRFKVRTEHSRKFLHVSGGLMCLLFPLIFTSHWWLLVLAVIAFSILFITYKTKQLASVHKIYRYSVGSILFPIPVYLCFLMAEKAGSNLYFYLPVSLLAISDTAAEIGGNIWGHLSRQFFGGQKTLAGSLCFFISAFPICFICLDSLVHASLTDLILSSFLIAFIATVIELITLHGWDNLTIPLIVIVLLYLFFNIMT